MWVYHFILFIKMRCKAIIVVINKRANGMLIVLALFMVSVVTGDEELYCDVAIDIINNVYC